LPVRGSRCPKDVADKTPRIMMITSNIPITALYGPVDTGDAWVGVVG